MFGQIESLKTSFPNRINIDFIYQGVFLYVQRHFVKCELTQSHFLNVTSRKLKQELLRQFYM